MGKARVGDRGREGELPGAQGLVFQAQLPVGGVVAVFAVPQDRAADAGQMGADLMGAPGDQVHLQQGKAAADRHRLVRGNDLPCARPGRGIHADQPLFGILAKIIPEGGRRRLGPPEGDAEIGLAQAAFPDQSGQEPLGLGVFGQQHKAAGAGVQPVAKAGIPVRRQPAFLIQPAHHPVAKGVGAVAVHRHAGRLVGDQQVIGLIDKVGRGAGREKLRPGRGGQAQLLIGEEQTDGIPVLHPGGKRLLFSVEFDLIFPQRLVEPPETEGGELLLQILVQPDGQQAFYLQFLHGFVSNSWPHKTVASGISRVIISQPGSLSSTCRISYSCPPAQR